MRTSTLRCRSNSTGHSGLEGGWKKLYLIISELVSFPPSSESSTFLNGASIRWSRESRFRLKHLDSGASEAQSPLSSRLSI